jgi:multiple antibiotic resistance protein
MYNMVAQTWLDSFLLTFVPLFIVIGAMRNLPFVISLNEERTASERDKLIRYALITAVIIGLFFLFVGKFVLQLMGISVGSFAIGGGIILLVLSVNYLLSNEVHIHEKEESLAAVPVGTPLTVGPATITTLLLLGTQFPIYWVLISFALNVAIVWIIFRESNRIIRILGKGGVMGVSKVFSLLLAAVAVNMVIRGLSMINVLHLPL